MYCQGKCLKCKPISQKNIIYKHCQYFKDIVRHYNGRQRKAPPPPLQKKTNKTAICISLST